MPHPDISYNFFMPVKAKRQPLHRSSMQSPHTMAAIFIFYFLRHCRKDPFTLACLHYLEGYIVFNFSLQCKQIQRRNYISKANKV